MNMSPQVNSLNSDELYNAILKYFRSKVNSKEDAKDLTQEVFLKISKSEHDLDSFKHLRSWIFTIARNTLTDHYRKRKILTNALEHDLEIPEDTENGSLIVALEKCLQRYMEKIPPETRELIKAADLQGKSQKEISLNHNMAYPTVRSKIQRGRHQIKQMFDQECLMEVDSSGQVLSCKYRNEKNSC